MPGPIPKRSDQRRRKNKPDVPVTSGVAQGAEAPPADEAWHYLARDWYLSLGESGQSAFYESSDWGQARIAAEILSQALSSGRLNAQLVIAWHAMATELLTSEGSRRRLRVELERDKADPDEDAADAAVHDLHRRLAG